VRRATRGRLLRFAVVAYAGAAVAGALGWAVAGCYGWDPREPFERNAPEVDRALKDLDAGRFESAEEALERYLSTGHCGDAGIGLPPSVREKYNGSFDLGLTLFNLAERFGQRFGEEESSDGGAPDPVLESQRAAEIACAQTIVGAIAGDPKVPAELRARAYYLAGNLEFLRRKYQEAVERYDAALAIVPGLYVEAGGDGIGRDAAHNRAIALRRIQDQKDAAPDAHDDAADAAEAGDGSEGGPDGGPDAGDDDDEKNQDAGGGDAGGQDGGGDAGGQDAGNDGGVPASPDAGNQPPDKQPQPQPEPQRNPSMDERMLEELDRGSESYQKQEAKMKANKRRARQVMEDK
jgi:tetratricopeptide (TPR) repeat protein